MRQSARTAAGPERRHHVQPAGPDDSCSNHPATRLDIYTMTAARRPPDDRQEPPAPADPGPWPTAMSPGAREGAAHLAIIDDTNQEACRDSGGDHPGGGGGGRLRHLEPNGHGALWPRQP